MRRAVLAPLVLVAALGFSACADKSARPAVAAVDPTAARLARQAPAPSAPGALSEIADVPQARRRVGYVNAAALAALLPDAEARAMARSVLGPGATELQRLPERAVRTAVQVASVSVLRGPGVASGRVIRGSGPLARTLADASPERSVIQPVSPSAVQSCLGDAAVETLVGPGTLGAFTAMGAGLRSGPDAPAGLKLVICISPRYRKQLYGSIRAMKRRFGAPRAGDPRSTNIGMDEVGEQQISQAIIPAERVSGAELLTYLHGGRKLQGLLPAPVAAPGR